MTKRILICLLTLCFMLGIVACGNHQGTPKTPVQTDPSNPSQATSSPLLYKVTDTQGNTVWLFGSIHVGQDSFYPLPDYVMDAYNGADALAVEFDIVSYQQDMPAMIKDLQSMIYLDGTTIKDHIPQDLYDQCVEILQQNNSYNIMLDYYCPSFWSQTIDQLIMMQNGINMDLGIDLHFLNLAHEEGKTILDIESASFQYKMLAGFSDELQVMLLQESVDSYAEPEEYIQSVTEMMDIWQRGNESAFAAMISTDYDPLTEEEQLLFDEYNNAMTTQRNINMADFAEDALVNGQELFICVGAAHVIGEGGMADLLAQRGYTVEVVQ